jgi:hypothetical protein
MDDANILAALLVTVIMGPMHVGCFIGVIILRSVPVFVVRVPRNLLASMVVKLIAFGLMAWLLLDPKGCPCGVVPFMFWVDWTGNCWYMLKTVFLLFRYEIQAALKKSKDESNVVAFDETNFFVRYRQILRSRTQLWLMIGVAIYVFVGNMIVLGIFADQAAQPCTYDKFMENNVLLGCLLFAWITAGPMMVIGTWASLRLKKFPHDNWKMGTENTIMSGFTTVGAIACATVLITIPTFEGILWVLFFGSIGGGLMQLLVPLTLHRRTLNQLAKLDIAQFASLENLLVNDAFIEAFGSFLRKEFSSENLFFWHEVNRLQIDYAALLGAELESVADATLMQAAQDCEILGSRCVGANAPWQLNVSSFTADAMAKCFKRIHEITTGGSTDGLAITLQETLQGFGLMQHEIYELLRKDPYPRFLLTSEADKLNQNETFKRMLAAEKLEEEVHASLGSSGKKSTAEGSEKNSDGGSRKSKGSKKESTKKEDKKQTRTSMVAYLTGAGADGSVGVDVKFPFNPEPRSGSTQLDGSTSQSELFRNSSLRPMA